ncbi:murein hydrolase activator EnvC family protein [Bartonella sp. A05]|uniref:murein hydrolase activator EnvC family protein n=1 Tax=Bartonella sp. A05 TaxID=2967261 RepID=UPI0022A96E9D|nr:M23 family metallopeptidase [Bartonella sp. A05]MCZ2203770.1 M23 family metallopeptidase [Bartonella sp. A05]
MYLRVCSDILWCSIQWIVFGGVLIAVVGCGSSAQRFEDGFYRGDTYSNTTTSAASQGGVIQSSELPPVEQSDNANANYSAPYASLIQEEVYSSDGRIMGAPPRNLGTLTLSQEDGFPVVRRNSYIVQSGDTPLSIAQQLGVSVEALKLVNGINGDFVSIGQVLNIPNERKRITSRASDNARIALKTVTLAPSKSAEKSDKSKTEQNFSRQVRASKSATDLPHTVTSSNDIVAPQSTGISNMRWPVRGRLLSHFGQKEGTTIKQGIDIAVPEGSSVKAAENGVVIYAADGLKKLGNVVMIRHEDNIITIYGHNNRLVVGKGQRVRRGDEIAKSGISGYAKTPRVYFEVRKNSEPVDPNKYLEK